MGWMSKAACLEYDPELWFPSARDDRCEQAQRICRHCPVVLQCGAHAKAIGAEYGIWGGKRMGRWIRELS